jgi:hypothetical protein
MGDQMYLSKYERWTIALSAVALVVGLAVSIHCDSGIPLTRSGAALTAIGIVFAAQKLQDKAREAMAEAYQIIVSQSHIVFDELGGKVSKGQLEAIAKPLVEGLPEVVEGRIRQFLMIETVVLVAGTVVWGFGDLPLDKWLLPLLKAHTLG